MAVLSREDFLNSINTLVGDNNDDSTLELVENMTDTFDSMANTSGEDWKKKYEDNDRMWRQKYRDRFFSGTVEDEDVPPEPQPKKYSFDELFK